MKQLFRSDFLPVFPAAAGILGLLLRIWLFASTDEKGLLPAKHVADTGLYILAAITLGFIFLATRDLTQLSARKRASRPSAILGCILSGAGMLCAGFIRFRTLGTRLFTLAAIACIAGGLVLLTMALIRFFRKRISYGFFAALTVCLMLDTVAQCKAWGAAPQLQEYFFPLMASVFSILTAYHATFLAAGRGKPGLLAFFSQGALFFCCTCLTTSHWPLYLGLAFWTAAQLYSCIRKRKEA